MDDIIKATLDCFNVDYNSSYEKALPILKFFTEIGIASLKAKPLKQRF